MQPVFLVTLAAPHNPPLWTASSFPSSTPAPQKTNPVIGGEGSHLATHNRLGTATKAASADSFTHLFICVSKPGECAGAVVTKCHKLGGLKQEKPRSVGPCPLGAPGQKLRPSQHPGASRVPWLIDTSLLSLPLSPETFCVSVCPSLLIRTPVTEAGPTPDPVGSHLKILKLMTSVKTDVQRATF